MIVSGYSLHLYCDAPGGCPRNLGSATQEPGPVEYVGEHGSRCRAAARRDGWLLITRDGRAYCRDHRKLADRKDVTDGC